MYATHEEAAAAAAPLGLNIDWQKLWEQIGPIAISVLIKFLLLLGPQPMSAAGSADHCCCIARLACVVKCLGHAQQDVADEIEAHLKGCCNQP